MAYGLKYELKCTSKKNGDKYSLSLSFDGYAGAEIHRNMPMDSPLKLRKDAAAVVRGTSLDFGIREAVDFEFDEFYSNNPKKIKAELYNDATLIWAGYNLPQQLQAEYVPAPQTIRFKATDGLALLKSEKFNMTGINTQLATIIYCVDKITLELGYSIAINLFETNHAENRSPLAQTTEDSSVFNGLDCYSVIEKILNKYDAEITQVNGRWHITRSTDKKSTRMLYTTAGVYEGTEAAAAVLNLGYPDIAGTDVWPVGNLNRSMLPGGNKVKITQNFGRKASLLNNYEFWRYAGGEFTGWTKSGTFDISQRIKDGKAYAMLEGYTLDPNAQIYQSIVIEQIVGDDFVFEVDFSPIGRYKYMGVFGLAPIQLKARIVILLTDGTDNYYLTKTGWSDTPSVIEETVSSALSAPVWNRLKIVTSGIPVSGTIEIYLLTDYETEDPGVQFEIDGIAYSEPLFYFLHAGELYPSGLESTALFDNSTEPNDLGEVSILSADAPDYLNKSQLYLNITRLADGTPTELWHILGSAAEYSLIVQLARTLASNNRIARQQLKGTIKGEGIQFNSFIKHTYNSNREFEIYECQWDLYNESYEVTLLELLAWSSEDITFTNESNNSAPSTGGSSAGAAIGIGIGTETFSAISASEILTELLTVDGTGSGLDADLLDGEHGSHYAPIDSPVFTTKINAPVINGSDAENGDISIKGTSHATKTTSYVQLQEDGGNVVIGSGGDANIRVLVVQGSLVEGLRIAADTEANLRLRGGATGEADIYLGANGKDNWAIVSNYDDRSLYFSSIFSGSWSEKARFAGGGNFMLGFTAGLAKLAINGGLHVGGESDPGDNNLEVDGTAKITGVATFGNDLGTASFASGFTGSGWKLDEATGKYNLTVDNLTIREALSAYELDIKKITSVGGNIIVSVASATSYFEHSGTILFDEDNGNKQIPFIVGDYIRAQIWTGRGVASYVGLVTVVTHDNTYGNASIVATTISGTPWNIMELVQIGHATNAARQNLIYITASDTNNPYIDMLAGVTDGSFSGKQKLRIGNLTGITDALLGALSGYGLWSDNVYLSGKVVLPSAGMTNEGSSASSVRIYAGDTYANRATAPFNVTQDGSLTATGVAEIGTKAVSDGTYDQALAIEGGNIYEPSRNDDDGTTYINKIGYQGGTTKYRDTFIMDGKGGRGVSMRGTEGVFIVDAGLRRTPLSITDNTTLTELRYATYMKVAGDVAKTLTLPTAANMANYYSSEIVLINPEKGNFTIDGNSRDIYLSTGTPVASFILGQGESCTLMYINHPNYPGWYELS